MQHSRSASKCKVARSALGRAWPAWHWVRTRVFLSVCVFVVVVISLFCSVVAVCGEMFRKRNKVARYLLSGLGIKRLVVAPAKTCTFVLPHRAHISDINNTTKPPSILTTTHFSIRRFPQRRNSAPVYRRSRRKPLAAVPHFCCGGGSVFCSVWVS